MVRLYDNATTRLLAAAALAACVLGSATSYAQAVSNRLDELTAELTKTRADLQRAQQDADAANKRYFQFNHGVVYSNAQAKVIYEEIVELEKKTVAKRKELNEMLMTTPEMKAVTEERRAAYERLSRLMDREQLLLNDIRVVKTRNAAEAADAP